MTHAFSIYKRLDENTQEKQLKREKDDRCIKCLEVTLVCTCVGCVVSGTTMIVLSHGVPSPLLFYGILVFMSGIPGCSPPLWAFAVPLA